MKKCLATVFPVLITLALSAAAIALPDSTRASQDTPVATLLFGSNVRDTARQDTLASTLSVESNVRDAAVYIDSAMIGLAPVNDFALAPGTHVLRIVRTTSDAWIIPAVTETVMFAAGAHIRRDARFPSVYHVTSEPYGARVFLNDSLVGQTPAILLIAGGNGIITISKEGYESVPFPLATTGPGIIHAVLVSKTGKPPSALVNDEQLKSLTPVYLASGAAILTGTAAAYFKIKADGYYNDYRNTGDGGALQHVRQFDTMSGVALVTSEVSLLLLSYLLLSH